MQESSLVKKQSHIWLDGERKFTDAKPVQSMVLSTYWLLGVPKIFGGHCAQIRCHLVNCFLCGAATCRLASLSRPSNFRSFLSWKDMLVVLGGYEACLWIGTLAKFLPALCLASTSVTFPSHAACTAIVVADKMHFCIRRQKVDHMGSGSSHP